MSGHDYNDTLGLGDDEGLGNPDYLPADGLSGEDDQGHYSDEDSQPGLTDDESHVDEEQYDEENEPEIITPRTRASAGDAKPFLKTPFGMIVTGVGTLSILSLGALGYMSMQANQAQVEEPMAGEVQSGGQVAQPAPQVAPQQFQQTAPQAQPGVRQVAGLPAVPHQNPEPKYSQELEQPHVAPAAPVQQTLPAADQSPLSGAVGATTTAPDSHDSVSEVEAEKLHSDVDANKAKTKELSEKIEASRVEMKQIISAVENNTASQSELTARLDKLAVQVEDNSSQLKALFDLNKTLKRPVPEVKQIPENTDPQVKGRQRLASFQIVDASTNGKMSIVKRNTDARMFTLYQDEVFDTYLGKLKVTSVANGGTLLLVGDKYYIDNLLQELPLVAKKVEEPKPRAATRSKREVSRSEASPAPVAQKRVEFAAGFSCNATFNDGKSFGITDNTGKFEIYNIGQTIPSIGVVKGLSSDGNLKVGDKIIRMAQ
ncbi:hypothetical protein ACYPKM_02735 [Pseudomonas aeruginosa]